MHIQTDSSTYAKVSTKCTHNNRHGNNNNDNILPLSQYSRRRPRVTLHNLRVRVSSRRSYEKNWMWGSPGLTAAKWYDAFAVRRKTEGRSKRGERMKYSSSRRCFMNSHHVAAATLGTVVEYWELRFWFVTTLLRGATSHTMEAIHPHSYPTCNVHGFDGEITVEAVCSPIR